MFCKFGHSLLIRFSRSLCRTLCVKSMCVKNRPHLFNTLSKLFLLKSLRYTDVFFMPQNSGSVFRDFTCIHNMLLINFQCLQTEMSIRTFSYFNLIIAVKKLFGYKNVLIYLQKFSNMQRKNHSGANYLPNFCYKSKKNLLQTLKKVIFRFVVNNQEIPTTGRKIKKISPNMFKIFGKNSEAMNSFVHIRKF